MFGRKKIAELERTLLDKEYEIECLLGAAQSMIEHPSSAAMTLENMKRNYPIQFAQFAAQKEFAEKMLMIQMETD